MASRRRPLSPYPHPPPNLFFVCFLFTLSNRWTYVGGMGRSEGRGSDRRLEPPPAGRLPSGVEPHARRLGDDGELHCPRKGSPRRRETRAVKPAPLASASAQAAPRRFPAKRPRSLPLVQLVQPGPGPRGPPEEAPRPSAPRRRAAGPGEKGLPGGKRVEEERRQRPPPLPLLPPVVVARRGPVVLLLLVAAQGNVVAGPVGLGSRSARPCEARRT